jgi:hypothetical protein
VASKQSSVSARGRGLTLNLFFENVWQAKELQAQFLDVWQGKDLRVRISEVWQIKELANSERRAESRKG